eukprot:CAMPEP_0176037364 /NCGR_PEP_ID=MMETSP0120_2-20121206/18510_1 /TAXON_ID=160619 /ORGANISM="Kryptoperidinium foliaceum, Strain CCMP 1326" /LENGTH=680 /DNA_ID=CAMNT_0017370753 /DNA_START=18 /DNA_END=2060 /DNA_ORIENTATION=+
MKWGVIGAMLAAAVGSAAAAGSRVTPIMKVIQLLEEMKAKGDSEKKAEAVRYSAFDQWCKDQSRQKQEEIDTATERIEQLTAKIEKATAHINKLTDRIQELDEDVGRWARDTKSASDVRAKEEADYQATSVDYGESIDAIDGALRVLKKKAVKTAQAEEALLQVHRLRMIPAASKKVLMSFIQQAQPAVEEMPDDHLSYEAPEAYGYEFQSGGVVQMLEQLKDEFAKKKYDMDAEEMKAQHAFEELAQQLADNTENAKHEIEKKTETRAQAQAEKEEMQGEKQQTESDRAEDQRYLDETKGLCAQKSEDFDARQKLRGEELEAIQKAIDIMSSDDVKGSGEKHLPSLIASGAPAASLVSLRSASRQGHAQEKAAAFLAEQAKVFNSRVLSIASQKVAADPFGKVKKMIKDLISSLMQEATSETEHKGWCDSELATNKVTRDSKMADVEQLTAQRDEQTTLIAQLTQDIEDLTKAMAELDASMAEATAEREEAKAKNAATIEDAKNAQVAVENAMAVLKDFYAKSAQATALVQQTPAEDAPETFDKPYTGLLPEGGSVVDFMEVILTDFSRLESETATAEATEQDEYEKFMFESKKDKALKENEKGHKEANKKDTESALVATEEELRLTQEQLDKAVAYYEKLKPTCVDSGISYEERVKRREEEIQSLQEALKILQGTDLS